MIKATRTEQAPRFKAGQSVRVASSRSQQAGSGRYMVVRSLPISGGRYQYRVKGEEEAFERVVDESQIELAAY